MNRDNCDRSLKLARRRESFSADTSLGADGLVSQGPAAEFLGISKRGLTRLLASGQLPYVRLSPNGDRLIPRRALVALIEARIVRAA